MANLFQAWDEDIQALGAAKASDDQIEARRQQLAEHFKAKAKAAGLSSKKIYETLDQFDTYSRQNTTAQDDQLTPEEQEMTKDQGTTLGFNNGALKEVGKRFKDVGLGVVSSLTRMGGDVAQTVADVGDNDKSELSSQIAQGLYNATDDIRSNYSEGTKQAKKDFWSPAGLTMGVAENLGQIAGTAALLGTGGAAAGALGVASKAGKLATMAGMAAPLAYSQGYGQGKESSLDEINKTSNAQLWENVKAEAKAYDDAGGTGEVPYLVKQFKEAGGDLNLMKDLMAENAGNVTGLMTVGTEPLAMGVGSLMSRGAAAGGKGLRAGLVNAMNNQGMSNELARRIAAGGSAGIASQVGKIGLVQGMRGTGQEGIQEGGEGYIAKTEGSLAAGRKGELTGEDWRGEHGIIQQGLQGAAIGGIMAGGSVYSTARNASKLALEKNGLPEKHDAAIIAKEQADAVLVQAANIADANPNNIDAQNAYAEAQDAALVATNDLDQLSAKFNALYTPEEQAVIKAATMEGIAARKKVADDAAKAQKELDDANAKEQADIAAQQAEAIKTQRDAVVNNLAGMVGDDVALSNAVADLGLSEEEANSLLDDAHKVAKKQKKEAAKQPAPATATPKTPFEMAVDEAFNADGTRNPKAMTSDIAKKHNIPLKPLVDAISERIDSNSAKNKAAANEALAQKRQKEKQQADVLSEKQQLENTLADFAANNDHDSMVNFLSDYEPTEADKLIKNAYASVESKKKAEQDAIAATKKAEALKAKESEAKTQAEQKKIAFNNDMANLYAANPDRNPTKAELDSVGKKHGVKSPIELAQAWVKAKNEAKAAKEAAPKLALPSPKSVMVGDSEGNIAPLTESTLPQKQRNPDLTVPTGLNINRDNIENQDRRPIIVRNDGKPFLTQAAAEQALKNKSTKKPRKNEAPITPETHKVITVDGGYAIAPKPVVEIQQPKKPDDNEDGGVIADAPKPKPVSPTPMSERANGHKAHIETDGKHTYEVTNGDTTFHYTWDDDHSEISLYKVTMLKNKDTGAIEDHKISVVDPSTGKVIGQLSTGNKSIQSPAVALGAMNPVQHYAQDPATLTQSERDANVKELTNKAIARRIKSQEQKIAMGAEMGVSPSKLAKEQSELARLKGLQQGGNAPSPVSPTGQQVVDATPTKPVEDDGIKTKHIKQPKPVDRVVYPDRDNLLTAIAKLKGLDRDDVIRQMGLDRADYGKRAAGLLVVFKTDGTGLSLDAMATTLSGYGYPVNEGGNTPYDNINGTPTTDALLDALRKALFGEDVGTEEYILNKYAAQREADQKEAEEMERLFNGKGSSTWDEADALDNVSDAIVDDIVSGTSGIAPEKLSETLKEVSNEPVIEIGGQTPNAKTEARSPQNGDAETTGTGKTGQQKSQSSTGQDSGIGLNPSFNLNAQTNEELAKRDADNKASEAKRQAEEKAAKDKAQADKEVSDFRLSGSNAPADIAMAGGQKDMFAPPTRGEREAEKAQTGRKEAQQLADAIGVKIEKPSPIFETYKDALDWISEQSKKYASEKAFKATDLYKSVYEQVNLLYEQENLLYKQEKAKISAAKIKQMRDAGIDVGDKVKAFVVGSFLNGQTHYGVVVLRDGYPYVKLNEKVTVSSKGKLRDTSFVAWNDRWVKDAPTNNEPAPTKQPETKTEPRRKIDFSSLTTESAVVDAWMSIKKGDIITTIVGGQLIAQTDFKNNPNMRFHRANGSEVASNIGAISGRPSAHIELAAKLKEQSKNELVKKLIGKTPEGKDLYEDGRGVRFTDNGRGVQLGEDVAPIQNEIEKLSEIASEFYKKHSDIKVRGGWDNEESAQKYYEMLSKINDLKDELRVKLDKQRADSAINPPQKTAHQIMTDKANEAEARITSSTYERAKKRKEKEHDIWSSGKSRVRNSMISAEEVDSADIETIQNKKEAVVADNIAPVVEAQHIENGKAEEVTPEIIRESLAKVDDKPVNGKTMSLKEAKQWLLDQVSTAIAISPSNKLDYKADSLIEAIKGLDTPSDRVKNKDQINSAKKELESYYITFDVPNDGVFKVLNNVESLQKFKKKVEANRGFDKQSPKKVFPSVAQNSADTTIAEFLGDGEVENAYEFAKLQDRPIRFGVGNSQGRENANAYALTEPVDLGGGFKGFVGLSLDTTKKQWIFIEENTRLSIGLFDDTKDKAIKNAKDKLAGLSESDKAKMLEQVKDLKVKQTDAELEQQWLSQIGYNPNQNDDEVKADVKAKAEDKQNKAIGDEILNQEPVKPFSAPSENSPETTIMGFLNDGELENAYFFAENQSKPIRFTLSNKKEPIAYFLTEPVDLGNNITGFVGISTNPMSKSQRWLVIEEKSRTSIGFEEISKRAAIKSAKARLSSLKKEDLESFASKIIPINKTDEEMKADWLAKNNIKIDEQSNEEVNTKKSAEDLLKAEGDKLLKASNDESNTKPSSIIKVKFPLDETVNAWQHSVRNPSEVAKSFKRAYEDYINDAYNGALPQAETDLQKKVLEQASLKLQQDYIKKFNELNDARSGVVSSFIAGRNNFNGKQAESRGNNFDKVSQRFDNWLLESKYELSTAVQEARSPEQLAAIKAEKDAKAQKLQDKNDAFLRKVLSFKKGDDFTIGKNKVVRVNVNKYGMPISLTLEGVGITKGLNDKINLFGKNMSYETVDDLKQNIERIKEADSSIVEEKSKTGLIDEDKLKNLEISVNDFISANGLDPDNYDFMFVGETQEKTKYQVLINEMLGVVEKHIAAAESKFTSTPEQRKQKAKTLSTWTGARDAIQVIAAKRENPFLTSLLVRTQIPVSLKTRFQEKFANLSDSEKYMQHEEQARLSAIHRANKAIEWVLKEKSKEADNAIADKAQPQQSASEPIISTSSNDLTDEEYIALKKAYNDFKAKTDKINATYSRDVALEIATGLVAEMPDKEDKIRQALIDAIRENQWNRFEINFPRQPIKVETDVELNRALKRLQKALEGTDYTIGGTFNGKSAKLLFSYKSGANGSRESVLIDRVNGKFTSYHVDFDNMSREFLKPLMDATVKWLNGEEIPKMKLGDDSQWDYTTLLSTPRHIDNAFNEAKANAPTAEPVSKSDKLAQSFDEAKAKQQQSNPQDTDSKPKFSRKATESDSVPIYRIDNKNFDANNIKPHGLYVSIPSDVSTFDSPHKDVGDTSFAGNAFPKNPLNVESFKIQHNRGNDYPMEVSAGVSALKQLVSVQLFERLIKADKAELTATIKEQFPDIDTSQYYDAYELLEVLGAQLAIQDGYDAIIQKNGNDPFNEMVILDNSIIESMSPTDKPKNSKGTGEGLTTTQTRAILVKYFGEKVIKALESSGLLTIMATPPSWAEPDADGAYDKDSGKAYLFTDNLSAETVVATLAHELSGHKGFQEMMTPTAYASLMRQFNRLVNQGNAIALAAKARAEAAESTLGAQQDELLPYLLTQQATLNATRSQQSAVTKVIEQVYRAVKAWLYRTLSAKGYDGLASKLLQPKDITLLAERMIREIGNGTNPSNNTKGKSQQGMARRDFVKLLAVGSATISAAGVINFLDGKVDNTKSDAIKSVVDEALPELLNKLNPSENFLKVLDRAIDNLPSNAIKTSSKDAVDNAIQSLRASILYFSNFKQNKVIETNLRDRITGTPFYINYDDLEATLHEMMNTIESNREVIEKQIALSASFVEGITGVKLKKFDIFSPEDSGIIHYMSKVDDAKSGKDKFVDIGAETYIKGIELNPEILTRLISTDRQKQLSAFQTLSHELTHVIQNQTKSQLEQDNARKGISQKDSPIGVDTFIPEGIENIHKKYLERQYEGSSVLKEELEGFNVGYTAAKAWLRKNNMPLRVASKQDIIERLEAAEKMSVDKNDMLDKFGYQPTYDSVMFSQLNTPQTQINAVRRKYEGTSQWMKAPNGQPTKLNEVQWLQVRTPNFKAWFGDWENDPANASKVVDSNGEPLVMYHGSKATDIVIFDTSSLINKGSYFTQDPTLAQLYANDHLGKVENLKNGGVVYPVFLSIKSPLILKREDKGFWAAVRDRFKKDYKEAKLAEDRRINASTFLSALAVEKLRNDSLDGIINIELDETIALDPTQIKSAIYNTGEFNPTNPDIRFSRTEQNPRSSSLDNFIAKAIAEKAWLTTEQINLLNSATTFDELIPLLDKVWNQYFEAKKLKNKNSTKTAVGVDNIKSLIRSEVDSGHITKEHGDLALYFAEKNPALFDSLKSFSFQNDAETLSGNAVGGVYNVVDKVIRISRRTNGSQLTIAHEVLHHAEEFLPENIKSSIIKAWQNDLIRAFKSAENGSNRKTMLHAIIHSIVMGDMSVIDEAIDSMDGVIPANTYHLFNPSEYWAENASRLMNNRSKRQDTWIENARSWINGLIQTLKNALGLQNDAAILKGLRMVLSGSQLKEGGKGIDTGHDYNMKMINLFSYIGNFNPDGAKKTKTSNEKYSRQSKNPITEGIKSAANDAKNSLPDPIAKSIDNFMAGRILPSSDMANITAKTELSLYHRTIGTQQNTALQNADFKKVYDMAQRYLQHVAVDAYAALKVAPNLLGKLESWSDLKKDVKKIWPANFIKQKADRAAVASIIFDETLNNELLSDADILKALTRDQRLIYREARDAIQVSLENTAKSEMVRKLLAAEAINWSTVESLINQDLPVEQFAQTVRDMVESRIGGFKNELKAILDADPKIKEAFKTGNKNKLIPAQKKELKKALTLKAQIETTEEALKSLNDVEARLETLIEQGYAPLMRFGEYTLTVRDLDGKVKSFFMFESKSEQVRAVNAIVARYGKTVNLETDMISKEEFKQFAGMTPETVALFAKETGMDKDEAYQHYLKHAIPARSAMTRMIKRKGTEGFSDDIQRVVASFVMSNARMSAKNIYAAQIEKSIQAIESGKSVKDQAYVLKENVFNPKENFAQLRNFLFLWNLGGSIFFGLLNMTQPYMQTLPHLSQYVPIKEAFDAIIKGSGIAGSAMKNGTTPKGYEKEYNRAVREGVVDPQNVFMLSGVERGKTGASNSAWGVITHTIGLIAQVTESFNRKAVFIASLEVAKIKGDAWLKKKGFNSAYDFAKDSVDQTQGRYDKANRSNLANTSVGAPLMVFKQFSINYVEQMVRMWKKEAASGDEGKKAVFLMLAMLASLSGVMGLPFIKDILDVSETTAAFLGNPVNIEREARLALGKDLADPLFNGVLNHFVFNQLGIDTQSRTGMPDLVPWTNIANPTLKDKAFTRELMGLTGATGGLINKAFDSAQLAAEGNVGAAAKTLAPRFLTSWIDGGKMALTNEVMDSKGNKIFDTTWDEGLVKFIDANPKRMADLSRTRGLEGKDKAIQAYMTTNFRQKIINAMMDDDKAEVNELMAKVKAWNESRPRYPVFINLNTLSENANKKEQTFDARESIPKGMDWMKNERPEM